MAKSLSQQFLHLGGGGAATPQPDFTGDMAWYEGYGKRHGEDGTAGRLVSLHTFNESWAGWEMHPRGDEVVVCTEGEFVLIQEIDGVEQRTSLRPGQYAINGPGVWHTADVEKSATALFITVGEGTEHRPR